MDSQDEQQLQVRDVADILRRSVDDVYELIESGELRFARTCDINRIRVPESAVEEYLGHDPR